MEGAIADRDGSRPAYVRFREGKIVETGRLGTDSSHGKERRIRGIVVPAPIDAHAHLGDAGFAREPPTGRLADAVGTPEGAKWQYLRHTRRVPQRTAMREALLRLAREGVAAVVDFREQGIAGAKLLRAAAAKVPIETLILGRPLHRPVESAEINELLTLSEGIGLSSSREESTEIRTAIADACHAQGKWYALHASEEDRELPDAYLHPRPDLLVHLLAATPEDLRTVAEAKVPVVVCPRSNALFGRAPDLQALSQAGVTTLLGTDNAMLNAPSMFRELEFAYTSQRLLHRPIPPSFLFRAACVEPWSWLGRPDAARVDVGTPVVPRVFRLPPDDPEYAIVTRATEQLMVDPGRSRDG